MEIIVSSYVCDNYAVSVYNIASAMKMSTWRM